MDALDPPALHSRGNPLDGGRRDRIRHACGARCAGSRARRYTTASAAAASAAAAAITANCRASRRRPPRPPCPLSREPLVPLPEPAAPLALDLPAPTAHSRSPDVAGKWVPRMSEDEIDASKAPLIEHLIELRSRLIKSVIAFLLAFFLCFMFAKAIYNILLWPYEFASGFSSGVKLIYTAPQNSCSPRSSSACSARPSYPSRWWRRRSTCSWRRASTSTRSRPSCLI